MFSKYSFKFFGNGKNGPTCWCARVQKNRPIIRKGNIDKIAVIIFAQKLFLESRVQSVQKAAGQKSQPVIARLVPAKGWYAAKPSAKGEKP